MKEQKQEKVYKIFKELNINYNKVEHPPLYKVEDEAKYGLKFDGVICKSLFIRNKDKSNYYLVALPAEKRINLKILEEQLQETRLSFGNEEILFEKFKIKSGSVSILNIIEVEKTDVKFIIDETLLNSKKVCFHPNINTETVVFSSKDIEKIMNNYNVEYKFILF